MIYTKMVKKAMNICYEQHKNQVDKAGMPYVFHPMHVAESMTDEDTTIVALLHDVIEDTNYTIEDVIRDGFSSEVVKALMCMTHADEMPYFDYINIVATNSIARKVKISDLNHNSDLSRIENPSEKDYKRFEKYKKCLKYLNYLESINYSYTPETFITIESYLEQNLLDDKVQTL